MVEQLTLNQRVQGSSPCRPTKDKGKPTASFLVYCISDGRAYRSADWQTGRVQNSLNIFLFDVFL